MSLLLLGLLLWCVVHLTPGLAPGLRTNVIARTSEATWKGGFALLVVLSIVLMVFGWRATTVTTLYDPPLWGPGATRFLVLVSFVLFAAANMKTNIKRIIRHPQLSGLIIWAIGHLLANGENRSVLLFAVLGIWAAVEIAVINRRDGPRTVPAAVPIAKDIIPIAGGAVVYVVFVLLHPYLFGVSPLG